MTDGAGPVKCTNTEETGSLLNNGGTLNDPLCLETIDIFSPTSAAGKLNNDID